jgi:hypothetical protein
MGWLLENVQEADSVINARLYFLSAFHTRAIGLLLADRNKTALKTVRNPEALRYIKALKLLQAGNTPVER